MKNKKPAQGRLGEGYPEPKIVGVFISLRVNVLGQEVA
jgi:hypothetical protein